MNFIHICFIPLQFILYQRRHNSVPRRAPELKLGQITVYLCNNVKSTNFAQIKVFELFSNAFITEIQTSSYDLHI